MIQVSLDTSFLISFADPERRNHCVAVEYFRHCVAKRIPMWISVVAAGEFEVGQPVSDLPLQSFRIQPYNLTHAIRAAALFRALRQNTIPAPGDSRPIIVNDLKIIAQAEEDQIPVILTEDASTLSRSAKRLQLCGAASVRTLLLTEGFTPGRLENPAQDELPLHSPSSSPPTRRSSP
jgi:predicted nucleic acid-binding protein